MVLESLSMFDLFIWCLFHFKVFYMAILEFGRGDNTMTLHEKISDKMKIDTYRYWNSYGHGEYEITKEQAQQIISHLKEQFSI